MSPTQKELEQNLQVDTYTKAFNEQAFQSDLINWFQIVKRDLPWRQDQDPYKVWVSEIMLQQTQVDTVIPYFNRFIQQFPTANALADADEQEVLKAWEGLGYYSRARNLHHAVKEVKANYGGEVPKEIQQLSTLKGIGPYTLGAIMSIAYDTPVPAVDGNVMRVLSRVLLIGEDIKMQKTRKLFERVIERIISQTDPSSFNQGLMELGALICRPKNPDCINCPVKTHCLALKEDKVADLPVKAKAKKQKERNYFVAVIETEDHQYLIEKRTEQGLLQNLFQFPMFETTQIDDVLFNEYVNAYFNHPIKFTGKLAPVKHVFSHLIWHLDVYHFKVEGAFTAGENKRWVEQAALTDYPFSVSHQQIIRQFD